MCCVQNKGSYEQLLGEIVYNFTKKSVYIHFIYTFPIKFSFFIDLYKYIVLKWVRQFNKSNEDSGIII